MQLAKALNNFVSFAGKIAKKVPNIFVIDSFDQKCMDIDGDGVDDVSHGRTVAGIIRGQCPNAKVTSLRLKSDNKTGLDFKSAIKHLNYIIKEAKSGKKVDAVNLSFGVDVTFEEASLFTGKEIHQNNLDENRKELLNAFLNINPPKDVKDSLNILIPGYLEAMKTKFQDERAFIHALRELVKLDVQVYLAAGNEGENQFDVASLVKGINTVGATDARGDITDFSANSSTVNRFEQGVFNVSEITDKAGKVKGYDVSGSGRVEIPVEAVSGGEQTAKKFAGKNIAEVEAEDQYYSIFQLIQNVMSQGGLEGTLNLIRQNPGLSEVLMNMKGKLFDLERLQGIGLPEEDYAEDGEEAEELNSFRSRFSNIKEAMDVEENEKIFIDFDGKFGFTVNDKGTVVYNPSKSGRPAVNVINGTSFSSPLQLAKDMIEKYYPDKFVW